MRFFLGFCLFSTIYFNTVDAAKCSQQSDSSPWPSSSIQEGGVFVFDPTQSEEYIQTTVNSIYNINGGPNDNGQFNSQRFALLFKPGIYPQSLNVPVGYYTSVIGLGLNPTDTKLNVVCQEGNPGNYTIGALNTFWRSAENFTMEPTQSYWVNGPICMLWAASQASPLRSVHLTGPNANLCLFQYVAPDCCAGYASGGFIANSSVEGSIFAGSQQQWFSRNTFMGSWLNGIWNMVFLGCRFNQAPAVQGQCNDILSPFTVIDQTPVIAEKPYITIDSEGEYSLIIPGVEENTVGPSKTNVEGTRIIPFEKVFVASPSDSVDKINFMINTRGYHVIFTPGIYNLKSSIKINRPDICVLGIGFPTLISTHGHSCIRVGNVKGVRLGGILFQAGHKETKTLLKWGTKSQCSSNRFLSREHSSANGFLYDCFVRVGGTNLSAIDPVAAEIMVQINSSGIVCDNLWLWRADHEVGGGIVKNGDNPCKTAFEANGNNITAYALAVEHTLEDLSVWNGNDGRCYFFQSEYPYDVTDEYAEKGYAAYRVNEKVENHQAWGVAVYSFFRDYDVTVENGIKTPVRDGIQFFNSLTRFLNGFGGIRHVINDNVGAAVDQASPGPEYVCTFGT